MLELITFVFYHNYIYTDKKRLFCKLYKWRLGFPTLLDLRKKIGFCIACFVGVIWIIFFNPKLVSLCFFGAGFILFVMQKNEDNNVKNLNVVGIRTPAQKRTFVIEEAVRKLISLHGKALGPKEWNKIKKKDIGLYSDLLCDECNHYCYYYTLAIAKIIKDCTLIWGGIEEPTESGHHFYAHAIILRNGYVYDSNIRQSIKLKDYTKLYKLKIYKQWEYKEYSGISFYDREALYFADWCEENNVLRSFY